MKERINLIKDEVTFKIPEWAALDRPTNLTINMTFSTLSPLYTQLFPVIHIILMYLHLICVSFELDISRSNPCLQ